MPSLLMLRWIPHASHAMLGRSMLPLSHYMLLLFFILDGYLGTLDGLGLHWAQGGPI